MPSRNPLYAWESGTKNSTSEKSMYVNMSKNRLSILQWETLGQEVANGVYNLPLGLGNKVECLENLDILTPNRLLLGRNNDRCPSGPNRLLLGRNNDRCPSGPLKTVEYFKLLLKTNENISAIWFNSWLISYVPTILDRPKWFKSNEKSWGCSAPSKIREFLNINM